MKRRIHTSSVHDHCGDGCNRYQQAYTGQIWSVELPDGETFETYLLGQAREFLQEMKLMNLLAKDQEIIITSTEKEEIRKLSEEYYESLTEDDIAYMGVKEDDVRTMYEEYFLSNKVVSELTKGYESGDQRQRGQRS